MLTRLSADNYRALSNFEMRPGRLNLLIGQNGSGKTTVFNVLGSIRDLVVLGFSAHELFASTKTKWDGRDSQHFELDIESEGTLFRYSLDIKHPTPGQPFIRAESVTADGHALFRFSDGEVRLSYDDDSQASTFPFRNDQSFLVNLGSSSSVKLGRLEQFKQQIWGLSIIQPNPFAMLPTATQAVPYLSRDGSNFAGFFEHLTKVEPAARNAIESSLRISFPEFKNFRFSPAGSEDYLLASFAGDHREFKLSEISEGQRVLAILYSAVFGLARKGALLCLDEPDNFVAPQEIQPWLQSLRDQIEHLGAEIVAPVAPAQAPARDRAKAQMYAFDDRTGDPDFAIRLRRRQFPHCV